MNEHMKRYRLLMVAFVCVAVLLVAPFACASEACDDAGGSHCVVVAHDDGPQAVVKPLATAPDPGVALTLTQVVADPSIRVRASEPRLVSAGVPLRI